MKITNKNSAIGLLDKMDPWSFTVSEDDEHTDIEYKRRFGLSLVREWPKLIPRFRKKVQYISDPFYQAYLKSSSKLAGVIDDEPINESGTFITKSSDRESNTIFYHIETSGKDKEFKCKGIIIFFAKLFDKEKPSLCILTHWMDKGIKRYLSEKATENKVTDVTIFADIFTLILFLKYCDLETKIIPPGRKGNHAGVKYVNETKQNVEILDSTWFTTIIRSEGFEVGGHFRLQPYGEGRSKRKLIWIDPFEKTGYTRTAKILNK